METRLPTPMTGRVYVNLLEGKPRKNELESKRHKLMHILFEEQTEQFMATVLTEQNQRKRKVT